jgi:hypothetical protein
MKLTYYFISHECKGFQTVVLQNGSEGMPEIICNCGFTISVVQGGLENYCTPFSTHDGNQNRHTEDIADPFRFFSIRLPTQGMMSPSKKFWTH